MTRLAIVALMSLAVAWALCYGALRTAEHIARHQITQQQEIEQ
jgi:hypothetical protein